jgi:hypothetical protein
VITEITKPASKDELIRAVKQTGWKFGESIEVVNQNDLVDLKTRVSRSLTRGKKLCIAIIERE